MNTESRAVVATIEIVLLFAPILVAGLLIAIAWSTHRFSSIRADAILGAIWYPFIGGLAGGLIGLSLSKAPDGGYLLILAAFLAVWIGGGLGSSWYYAPLRKNARPGRVSSQIYYQDISYLADLPTVTVLGGREYARWQARARELKAHGRWLGEQAPKGRNFRNCWASLKRIVRVVIILEVIVVVVLAVSNALLLDEPWLLLGISSGISLPCAVWLSFLWRRHFLLVNGWAAERAAEQIQELIQQFEVEASDTPPVKFRQRIARHLLSIMGRRSDL